MQADLVLTDEQSFQDEEFSEDEKVKVAIQRRRRHFNKLGEEKQHAREIVIQNKKEKMLAL